MAGNGQLVVVKHTFLELINDSSVSMRCRAFTDSCMEKPCAVTPFETGCVDDEDFEDSSTHVGSIGGDESSESGSPRTSRSNSLCDVRVQAPVLDASPPGVWLPDVAQSQQWTTSSLVSEEQHWAIPTVGHSQPWQRSHEVRTTLMLRNLPSCFSRDDLLETLDSHGFSGDYDFVYFPIDFYSGAGLGYCFVNVISSERAMILMSSLQGFSAWRGSSSHKVLDICWSQPHQGLEMLIERYRNSRVMHSSVPDHYKPALFQDGVRVPFPRNTKRIRPPVSGGLFEVAA